MTLVTEAVIFAAQAHDGAARKGSMIPYIVHPMEVVAICATLTDDQQVLAAAALVLCAACYLGEWRINRWTYAIPAESAAGASALNESLAALDGKVRLRRAVELGL